MKKKSTLTKSTTAAFLAGAICTTVSFPAHAGGEFQRHYDLGKDFLERQEYKLAIQELDIATKNPASPSETATALVDRGTAYSELKNYKQAIADFNKAISFDAKSHLAYNNRGAVYFRQGLPDQAIPDFDRALSLDPEDKYALVNRAGAYLMTERAASLAGNTETWLKGHHWKSDFAAHATVLTALAFLQGGQKVQEQSIVTEALKNLNKLLWPYHMLTFLSGKGDPEKVVEAAQDSTYDLTQAQCFLALDAYFKGKSNYDLAREKFSFVVQHGTTNSVEYWLAKYYLAKLTPPKPAAKIPADKAQTGKETGVSKGSNKGNGAKTRP